MAEVTKVTSKVRHLAFWCVILGAAFAFAAPRKISKDLQKQSSQPWVNVIVQYRVPPSQKHFAKVAAKGGTLQQNLPLINGAAFTVKGNALAALAKDSNVAYISLDRTVWATATVTDLYDQAVLAPYAWSRNFTGRGIGVAVIDSGITASRDFTLANGTGSRIVYNQNFASGPNTAADLYGHGTHVAGILAGNGMNSRGVNFRKTFMGIADNASLINLRVLDQNGVGRDSAVIAAIEKAISLKSKYNIRVINLSLGRAVYESYKLDPLCQAVEAAWKAGIVVVVAAGNEGRNDSAHTDGYGTIAAPGNDPYAITVGAMKPMGTATRADDLIASYSSKGPTLFDHAVKPDIVAPGNQVVSLFASNSTLAQSYPLNNVPFSYYRVHGSSAPSNLYYALSGTSMATPVVSGAVALLLQQNPRLTPDQVKARLMKTAFKSFPGYSVTIDPITHAAYTSQYDIFTVGAGYLDIAAALNNTDLANLPALSPTAVFDPTTNTVKLVLGNAVTWGTSLTWGTALIWGSNLFLTNGNPINGSALIWGTNSIPGLALIWGSGLIWGTDSPQAEKNIDLLINGEP